MAKVDEEKFAPHKLKAVAATAEGRQMLIEMRATVQAVRDEYAEHSQAQLAAHDDLLAKLDTALEGREVAV